MRSKVLGLVAAGLLMSLAPAAASSAASRHAVADNGKQGLVWTHGAHGAFGQSRGHSPNMTYHGGVIMPTANVYSIFWGTSWAGYSGDKMTGIDSFNTGFSNSNYAKTSDEYSGSNGAVGPTVTAHTHVVDTSAASGGDNPQTILNEVVKEMNAGSVPLDKTGNGYYAVYVDLPRGSAQYCAYHDGATIISNNVSIRAQFAFFWKLDGDPGCDPGDTSTGHSQGLAAIANVSAHELSEARTDPTSPGAWYDSQGNENGDKCAWAFNVPSVTFSNGTKWKVQGEWSNAAYNAGTGYANRSGQHGCLDGH
jgi:hypothetical protein